MGLPLALSLIAVGLSVTALLQNDGGAETSPTTQSSESIASKTFDPSGAEDLISEAVEGTYEYNPESVACPSEVPAERGYIFQCEALIEKTRLIPVDVKVVSPLGFVEVVSVGAGGD